MAMVLPPSTTATTRAPSAPHHLLPWQAMLGGGGAGSLYWHQPSSGVTSTTVVSTNVGLYQIRIPNACTVTGIYTFQLSASSGSTLSLGLYADSGSYQPTKLLWTVSGLSLATANATLGSGASLIFTGPTVVWAAFSTAGTTSTATMYCAVYGNSLRNAWSAVSDATQVTRSLGQTTMPSDATALTLTAAPTVAAPNFYFTVA